MKKGRLSVLIPLLLILSAVLGSALLFWQQTYAAHRDIQEREIDDLQITLTYLQNVLSTQLAADNHEDAKLSVSVSAMHPGIRTLLLADENNSVTLANRYIWEGSPAAQVSRYDEAIARQVRQTQASSVSLDAKLLHGYYPVILRLVVGSVGVNRIGVLFVEFDLAPQLAEARHNAMVQSSVLGGLMLAVAIAVAVLLHWIVSRRVAKIVAAAQGFAAGNMDARVDLRGGDELAELGLAFNSMVSQRKHADESLRHLNERYSLATRAARLGVWDWDIQSNELVWTDGMYELYGVKREDFVGAYEAWLQGVHPDDRAASDEISAQARRGEREYDTEFRVVWPDGGIHYLKAYGQIVRDAHGKPLRMTGVNYDITERKRVEDALVFVAQRGWQTDAENFFNALAQFLGEKLDMEYVLIDRMDENPEMAETVALYAKGAIAPNMRYTLKGTPCENVMGKRLCIFRQGVQQLFPEDTLLPGMGAESYIGMPLWDSMGRPIGLIAVMGTKPLADDASVTHLLQLVATRAAAELERQRAEGEIRKLNQALEHRVATRTAELLAANKELEAFSYSVSHDLRAPLRHIDGFLCLFKERMATSLDDKSQHYMDTIAGAARRMGTLIDDLLSFSRMGRHAMVAQRVELDALVREVIEEFEPITMGRTIDWRIGVLPVVCGVRAMLRVALVNLISNALKFTQKREKAVIEIGGQSAANEDIIFVRDNGAGFDMQYADKLFGVFERLHASDEFEGTGIGLANVRRVVTRHGGRTWAEGRVDGGATFYFSLPPSNGKDTS